MKDDLILVNNENDIINAMKESFIDKDFDNETSFNYVIIDNRTKYMLEEINDLIEQCDEFFFCVAFLQESGLQSIINSLNSVKNKIKGKIIIGNKSNFSDAKTIKRLNDFQNIDVRLNMNNKLHTKGYFFRKDEIWTSIIGSSNLTCAALKTNEEWNLEYDSYDNSLLVTEVKKMFEKLWNESNEIDQVIDQYELDYNNSKKIYVNIAKEENKVKVFKPNKMQKEALINVEKIRKKDDRALVISATGTGKTYLAAFCVKEANPLKMLFIVHNNNILNKAKDTFELVIPEHCFGIYNGSTKNIDVDYLFANINTLSSDEHLSKFNCDEFDYIIVDEVHHSGANIYKKIFNYFKPKFWLGLTATPDRNDNFNVYELFKYNVAYEIRLNDAIDNNLVVPFHYYGVTDIEVNGENIENDRINEIDIKTRAQKVKEYAKLYGFNGNKVHGLIFVDSKETAKLLEIELNMIGLKTKMLSGEDNETTRINAINRLENENNDYLDYIITIDIFNEGIDIPCINQVILLRPTKSAIVYVQQLGRGLRKNDNKNYLVVIDFIGNYNNNFLIPMALSGDYSGNINMLNLFINSRGVLMPGLCTLNFEKIAKNLILDKIDNNKFKNKKIIEADYIILKQRLNHIPMLNDFFENNKINPEHILKYKRTYPEVIETFEKIKYSFSFEERKSLDYLYNEFNNAKRIHEILIIKELLENNNDVSIEYVNDRIEKYLSITNQIENTLNAYKHLEKKIFIKDNTRKQYKPLLINSKLNYNFYDSYVNKIEYKEFIDDYIRYNLNYNHKYYVQNRNLPLLLGHSYTRKQCFHLLNLDYNPGRQINGYFLDKEKNKVLIFMKADQSSYSNTIKNNRDIVWYSQNNRSLKEGNTEFLIANNKVELEIFMKKAANEELYYLGRAKSIFSKNTMNNENQNIVKYVLRLENPIDSILIRYFMSVNTQ
ncbi:MAG: DUF3427 domain-containing protein [Bacilli bacterium]|nr:DUF3427 domain-containing protein [Bacilli bacterium]